MLTGTLSKRGLLLAGTLIIVASGVTGIAVNGFLPGSVDHLERWEFRCDSESTKYINQVLSQRLRGLLTLHNYTYMVLDEIPGLRIQGVDFELMSLLLEGYLEVRFGEPGGERLVVRLSMMEEAGGVFLVGADGGVSGRATLPWHRGNAISIRFDNEGIHVKPGDSEVVSVSAENFRPESMEIGVSAAEVILSNLRVEGERGGEKFEIRENFTHPLSGRGLVFTGGFTAFIALVLSSVFSLLLVPGKGAGTAGTAARVSAPAAALLPVAAVLYFTGGDSAFAAAVGIPILVAVPLLAWAASLVLSRRHCLLNGAYIHEPPGKTGSAGDAAAHQSTPAAACPASSADPALSEPDSPADAGRAPSSRGKAAALILLLAAIIIAGFPAGRTMDGDRVILSGERSSSGKKQLGLGSAVEFPEKLYGDQEIFLRCVLAPGTKADLAFHRVHLKTLVPVQRVLLSPVLERFRKIRLTTVHDTPDPLLRRNGGKLHDRPGYFFLTPGRPHEIRLRIENGEAVLNIDGGENSIIPGGPGVFGETALVVFEGSLDLEELSVTPLESGPLPWKLKKGLVYGLSAWLVWLVLPFILTLAGGARFPRRTRGIMRTATGSVFTAGLLITAPLFAGRISGDPGFAASCLGGAVVLSLILVSYCNFDNSKRPNVSILLLIFLLVICGEAMARTSRYGDFWKPEFYGGYMHLGKIEFSNPPGARIGDSTINSHGFRGAPVEEKKPPDTFRIVCMGGSTTFGDGLARLEETYPFKLEEKLRAACPETRIEVINAGVPATSSEQNLRFLGNILRFSPDVIIGSFGNNDISGPVGPGTDRELITYRERTERSGPGLLERAADRLVRFRLGCGAALWLDKQIPRPHCRVSPERYEEIIGEFSVAADRSGFLFLLLLEPREDYALKGASLLDERYDIARRLEREGSIRLVDPGPYFAPRRDEKLFVDMEHPSGKGNECVAGAVFDAFADRDLLPCRSELEKEGVR